MALFHAGKDSMIEKMFIEPEEPGDPFKVSDAETMLNYINPQATKPKCVSCSRRWGVLLCPCQGDVEGA